MIVFSWDVKVQLTIDDEDLRMEILQFMCTQRLFTVDERKWTLCLLSLSSRPVVGHLQNEIGGHKPRVLLRVPAAGGDKQLELSIEAVAGADEHRWQGITMQQWHPRNIDTGRDSFQMGHIW